jgi:hypothetical protein
VPRELDSTPTMTDERVSIREVRESSYRALVAHGASYGEADVAADQVLHAELHTGTGLAALVADLRLPPWPNTGMTLTRSDTAPSVAVLRGSGRPNSLRQGSLLTELHASHRNGEVAVCSGDLTDLDATWDHLLLAAAHTTGRAVAAVLLTPEGGPVSARGADTHAGVGPLEHSAVLPDALRVTLTRHLPRGGVTVLHPRALVPTAAWLDATARITACRSAADTGLVIDGTTWHASYQAARAFLVPE